MIKRRGEIPEAPSPTDYSLDGPQECWFATLARLNEEDVVDCKVEDLPCLQTRSGKKGMVSSAMSRMSKLWKCGPSSKGNNMSTDANISSKVAWA